MKPHPKDKNRVSDGCFKTLSSLQTTSVHDTFASAVVGLKTRKGRGGRQVMSGKGSGVYYNIKA